MSCRTFAVTAFGVEQPKGLPHSGHPEKLSSLSQMETQRHFNADCDPGLVMSADSVTSRLRTGHSKEPARVLAVHE